MLENNIVEINTILIIEWVWNLLDYFEIKMIYSKWPLIITVGFRIRWVMVFDLVIVNKVKLIYCYDFLILLGRQKRRIRFFVWIFLILYFNWFDASASHLSWIPHMPGGYWWWNYLDFEIVNFKFVLINCIVSDISGVVFLFVYLELWFQFFELVSFWNCLFELFIRW